jgi:hypothetical protein
MELNTVGMRTRDSKEPIKELRAPFRREDAWNLVFKVMGGLRRSSG